MCEHDALRQACGATAVKYEGHIFFSIDLYITGIEASVVLQKVTDWHPAFGCIQCDDALEKLKLTAGKQNLF